MPTQIQEPLIRLFVHPFRKDRRQNHLKNFSHVQSILVLCPPYLSALDGRKLFNFLQNQKSLKYICYINLNVEQDQPAPDVIKAEKLILPGNSLYKLLTSQQFKGLRHKRFDLLLDLNNQTNLLGAVLCRILNPAIRLSFKQSTSTNYYNMEFVPDLSTPYNEQLESMFRFLEQAISSQRPVK